MNSIKQKLQAGEPTIGTWLQIPSPDIAEMMADEGFDWIAIDLEHGVFDMKDIANICRAMKGTDTQPFVRIASYNHFTIPQLLDCGIQGIIQADVHSAVGVRATKHYSSRGAGCGYGYSRANLWGKYFRKMVDAEDIMLVGQYEDKDSEIDKWIKPGILDATMIGPYDLSASLGAVGQLGHPLVTTAMDNYLAISKKNKVPPGIHIVNPEPGCIDEATEKGYRFIAMGTEAVFLRKGMAIR